MDKKVAFFAHNYIVAHAKQQTQQHQQQQQESERWRKYYLSIKKNFDSINFDLVKRNKNGEVVSVSLTMENLKKVLLHIKHELPAYNNMLHKHDYPAAIKGEDSKNAYITRLKDLLIQLNFTKTELLGEYMRALAVENQFHPVKKWLESDTWDKKLRVNKVFNSIVTTLDKNIKEIILKKWFYQIFAAIYDEKYKNEEIALENVLVLSGRQGIGKTRWFRSLLPVKKSIITGFFLDLKSKDSQLNALSSLIVELSELEATFRKSDIEEIKAFLSKTVDEIRRPYAAEAVEMKRRTVFAATVNSAQFLNDPTGNRRFFVIPVKKITPLSELFNNDEYEIKQFWLELLYMFNREHEQLKVNYQQFRPLHILTNEEFEMVNKANAEHINLNALAESFLHMFYDSSGNLKAKVISACGKIKVLPHENMLTIKQILFVLGAENAAPADIKWLRSYIAEMLNAGTKRTKRGIAYALPAKI